MQVQRLGAGASAAAVLRGLHERAQRLGLPPPAALTGEWFGSAAVLVPSVALRPRAVNVAFAAGGAGKATLTAHSGPVGGGWIGYRGYPDGSGALPEAAGGWTDCVLRLDLDNCWWFESLSGAPCPPGLTAAVAVGAAESSWRLDWLTPDAAAHQHRVRQCLAAIADGEVYQACVCTRFAGNLDGEAVQLFASGIEADEPARAAYLAGPWGAVASFSPERRPRRLTPGVHRGRQAAARGHRCAAARGDFPTRLRAVASPSAQTLRRSGRSAWPRRAPSPGFSRERRAPPRRAHAESRRAAPSPARTRP